MFAHLFIYYMYCSYLPYLVVVLCTNTKITHVYILQLRFIHFFLAMTVYGDIFPLAPLSKHDFYSTSGIQPSVDELQKCRTCIAIKIRKARTGVRDGKILGGHGQDGNVPVGRIGNLSARSLQTREADAFVQYSSTQSNLNFATWYRSSCYLHHVLISIMCGL